MGIQGCVGAICYVTQLTLRHTLCSTVDVMVLMNSHPPSITVGSTLQASLAYCDILSVGPMLTAKMLKRLSKKHAGMEMGIA